MTIKARMIFLSIAAAAVILGSIVAQLMSSGANETGNITHKTRYLSYIISDEFRQTSMDLTRLCRTYVSTGDQKHWDAYFDIVNWRSGKLPRPSYV
ncbi:MAG: methyl-accepting chemotaxis protein, partial [Deltaproteobacteria bacterium]|nr:methyl-accepting chemotaxis protein [Deltaproteobacteria bacterium]